MPLLTGEVSESLHTHIHTHTSKETHTQADTQFKLTDMAEVM